MTTKYIIKENILKSDFREKYFLPLQEILLNMEKDEDKRIQEPAFKMRVILAELNNKINRK
jgi:hypothetical protein